MVNPIQRQNTGASWYNNNAQKQGGNKQKKKSFSGKRLCWKFNKNQTCEPGCNFEHKCSYCGQTGHSVLDCPKLHQGKRKHH